MTPNLIFRTYARVGLSTEYSSHYRHYRHSATHASLYNLLRTNCKENRLKKRKFLSFGAFAKLRKATISFVMSVCLSVCLHGITRLPLDGFAGSLIFVDFF